MRVLCAMGHGRLAWQKRLAWFGLQFVGWLSDESEKRFSTRIAGSVVCDKVSKSCSGLDCWLGFG